MQKARCHTQKDAPTACRRTGSGSISLFCSKCFSPFPHGTCPLSVSREYLALPDGPGGFTQDFSCPALLRILLIPMILACKGLSPATAGLSNPLPVRIMKNISQSYYPAFAIIHIRFGLFRFRSPLLAESFLFSLPGGTKMFQFPPFAFPQ